VSRDWPSLLAFANFFLAGRVHKPTMKVNHLPIRSSWQKIETDCERGDAGRIKNLFCSFSNRKYVVFF
jgi:hypothetical protein